MEVVGIRGRTVNRIASIVVKTMDGPQLLSSLKDTCVAISTILTDAEQSFAGSDSTHTAFAINVIYVFLIIYTEMPDDFVTSKYGLLGGAIGCYCNLFKRYSTGKIQFESQNVENIFLDL